MKKLHLQKSYIYRKLQSDEQKRLMNKIQQIKHRKTLHGIDSKLPKLGRGNGQRGQPKQRYKQIEKQNRRLTNVIQTTRVRQSQFCTSRIVLKQGLGNNRGVFTNRDEGSFVRMSGIFSPVPKNKGRGNLGKMKTANDSPQDVQCFF